jgi:hypothetical protein
MPGRQFRTILSDSTFVVVEFFTINGEVVSFVVRLMLKRSSGEACVARYDTAHGRPHFDRMNSRGRLVEKKWLLGMSFSEALCYAIKDMKSNHEIYINQYEKTADKKA